MFSHLLPEQIYRYYQGSLNRDTLPQPACRVSLVARIGLAAQCNQLQQCLWDFSVPVFVRLQHKAGGAVWTLWLEPESIDALIERIKATDFDYLQWPDQADTAPQLLLFDMDSTFIQIEVIDQLAIRHQVGDKVAAVTEQAMRGELDFAQSLVARVACLEGLAASTIADIAASLPISPGIETLVDKAHSHAVRIAIVSGGFTPFVETLRQKLGLYRVKANHLQIQNDQLTGQLEGTIVDAAAKANFLHQLCEELAISPMQVMALGDGANDLPMMNAAGFNLAYRAKPKVQQAARGRLNQVDFDRLCDVFDWR